MSMDIQHNLQRLYQRWSGQPAEQIIPLAADGSSRRYYRIPGAGNPVIGVWNGDRKENVAFLTFSRHFRKHGLPAPEIYAEDLDTGTYLEQDLGDETLFSLVTAMQKEDGNEDRLTHLYKQVLEVLPRFQITAGRDLDYTVCFPRDRFDAQSIRWDLNYFKYCFLKLAEIPFDEQALEEDFDRFIAFLLQTDCEHFLYRDFQSRNIMWLPDGPYFIDYQGGRRGALQYDAASLLLDARADLSWSVREELLDYYMEMVSRFIPVQRASFLHHYYGYALVRVMQALGAYGLRGLHEGKSHFLRSIPYALGNLEGLLAREQLPVRLQALFDACQRVVQSASLQRMGRESGPALTVHIQSFSYKNGLPRDESGHGGGFVFDCRILPNPGRNPAFARLTGQDAVVIGYLEQESPVREFLHQAISLIDQAVTHHRNRGFTDLTVAFGCTGGQHRSVFCADHLAAHLRPRGDLRIDLRHRMLERGI